MTSTSCRTSECTSGCAGYVPDLVVVYRGSAFHDNGYDPGGVLLVVEVVSPSSLTLDRITKPAVYAEQGIPFYWRIEAEPRLLCHRLDSVIGGYVLDRELAPGAAATSGQVSVLGGQAQQRAAPP